LVDWEDVARWQMIDRALKLPFKDPIETYSTSEHVYTGLGIPTDSTGRLAKKDQTRAGLNAEEVEDLGGTAPRQKSPARGSSTKKPASRGGNKSIENKSTNQKPARTGKTRDRKRTRATSSE